MNEMMKATDIDIFDIICSHAARHGRDEKLFGKNFPLAREAIAHSLAGTPFSEIWFEVPLLGAPRFDLYVVLSYETIKARKTLPADLIDGDFNAEFELYADKKIWRLRLRDCLRHKRGQN